MFQFLTIIFKKENFYFWFDQLFVYRILSILLMTNIFHSDHSFQHSHQHIYSILDLTR
ncbi:hypothetical protein BN1088_1310006 [Sphingobacterium sp. PM2-P1-29]|nr:hypothetical protein BN1088_1310006 [Sphingobacterium sp. PM2-P1-29]